MTRGTDDTPALYGELAEWWPVLSKPEHYAEEAAHVREALVAACAFLPRTMLELGCGGGSNASHLKEHFQLTLVDVAPGMLRVSRALNPECEHLEGDMRTVRLGREFDVVFVHDAINYMATKADLARAFETTFVHCRPGGAALFAPDATRETFRPGTSHGGHEVGDRALRYLQWDFDPDPEDDTGDSIMVYVRREAGRTLPTVTDRHVFGLFPRETWLRTLASVGFEPREWPTGRPDGEPGTPFYVGSRPR